MIILRKVSLTKLDNKIVHVGSILRLCSTIPQSSLSKAYYSIGSLRREEGNIVSASNLSFGRWVKTTKIVIHSSL
jgi:hypothetical protein